MNFFLEKTILGVLLQFNISENDGVIYFLEKLRPYGLAHETLGDDNLTKRLNTMELLNRPKVAMSKFAATLLKNMPVLENSKQLRLYSKIFKKNEHFGRRLKSHFF